MMTYSKTEIWTSQRETLLVKAMSTKLFHIKAIHDNKVDNEDDLAWHVDRFMAWEEIANSLHRLLNSKSEVNYANSL